jgi:hypothetical protein
MKEEDGSGNCGTSCIERKNEKDEKGCKEEGGSDGGTEVKKWGGRENGRERQSTHIGRRPEPHRAHTRDRRHHLHRPLHLRAANQPLRQYAAGLFPRRVVSDVCERAEALCVVSHAWTLGIDMKDGRGFMEGGDEMGGGDEGISSLPG